MKILLVPLVIAIQVVRDHERLVCDGHNLFHHWTLLIVYTPSRDKIVEVMEAAKVYCQAHGFNNDGAWVRNKLDFFCIFVPL